MSDSLLSHKFCAEPFSVFQCGKHFYAFFDDFLENLKILMTNFLIFDGFIEKTSSVNTRPKGAKAQEVQIFPFNRAFYFDSFSKTRLVF